MKKKYVSVLACLQLFCNAGHLFASAQGGAASREMVSLKPMYNIRQLCERQIPIIRAVGPASFENLIAFQLEEFYNVEDKDTPAFAIDSKQLEGVLQAAVLGAAAYRFVLGEMLSSINLRDLESLVSRDPQVQERLTKATAALTRVREDAIKSEKTLEQLFSEHEELKTLHYAGDKFNTEKKIREYISLLTTHAIQKKQPARKEDFELCDQ
jgi:hypothetical protein